MALIKREYTDQETVITGKNLNDIQDAVIALEDGLFSVDNDKSGEVITITDASNRGFRIFKIFGKTTQNGTPTPDAPVDLVSVGNSGNITVNVTGQNDSRGMTIATPNGLPGIPVTSGGNYTDASGQQWICDEIDLARGVYVQRIGETNVSIAMRISSFAGIPYVNICYGSMPKATDAWDYNAATEGDMMAECASVGARAGFDSSLNTGCVLQNATPKDWWFGFHVGTTLEQIKSKINGTKLFYKLATPVFHDLSEEELAAYSALHTYKDHTTVSNDSGAWMELEYVMDAKKYIDSLITGTILPATVE
jgi:hypothetical protein